MIDKKVLFTKDGKTHLGILELSYSDAIASGTIDYVPLTYFLIRTENDELHKVLPRDVEIFRFEVGDVIINNSTYEGESAYLIMEIDSISHEYKCAFLSGKHCNSTDFDNRLIITHSESYSFKKIQHFDNGQVKFLIEQFKLINDFKNSQNKK